MNTKTTLVLALVAAVITGYVFLWEKPWEEQKVEEKPETAVVALFNPKPENPDRVEIARRDGTKLVFAREDTGSATEKKWKLVEPFEAPAAEYQVTNIVNQLGEIKYTKKYAPGSKDRPSDEVAGLAKPVATVKVVKGGKDVADLIVGSRLPIGKGNYIKLAGSEDILESENDLTSTFTGKVETFRDKRVLSFDLNDVKRVKVEGARNFVLVKNGQDWVIEEPIRGRADKTQAENVVRPISSLYVTEFKDDAPVAYKPYGLDPAKLKVTVETEKTIPPKAKPGDPNTQPADVEPTVKKATYELLVGGPAEVGGKQFFARLGSQPWVFSISDYTFKQLSPELAALQDKKLAVVDSAKVKSVQIDGAEGAATFTRNDKGWLFADDTAADAVAVDDLLKAVGGLQAVEFVDPKTELIQIDWDKPRAKVAITQEGSLAPITVLVGPASASGKMVFVRNAAEDAVAAVHEDAVVQLLQPPVAYRDRTVMRFDRTRANKIEIMAAGRDKVTLAQNKNVWTMTEPVQSVVDRDAVRNLTQDLSSLKARRVVGVGDKAKYGLDQPEVTLAVYVEPLTADPNAKVVGGTTKPASATATQPATTKPASGKPTTRPGGKTIAQQIKQIEELLEYQRTNPKENPAATQMLKDRLAELQAQAASQPAGEVAAAVATAPAAVDATPSAPAAKPEEPTVLHLAIARKDGKVYTAMADGDRVYELDERIYDDVTAEMHDRQIARIDTTKATEVEFGPAGTSVALRKSGDDWKYVADPVLPIDKEKVTKALDAVKDISTHRFVKYTQANLADYGLDKPAKRLRVLIEGGQKIEVVASDKGPEGDADGSKFAAIPGEDKVFLLKGDEVAKFEHKVDDFEKGADSGSVVDTSDAPHPPPGFRPPAMR